MDLRERGAVGGQPEEQAMAERQQPGVAEQQIEAQPDHDEDRDLGGGAPGVAGDDHGPRQDDQPDGEDQQRMTQGSGVHWRLSVAPAARACSTFSMET